MVKISAKTVDEYLAEVSENRVEAVTTLRDLGRGILVGYDEGMAYGMPSYSRNGQVEVGFASQRNYIAMSCRPTRERDAFAMAAQNRGISR